MLFDTYGDIDRIGGKILFYDEGGSALSSCYEQAFGLDQNLYIKNTQAAVTANMISKRKVFDKVGLFNDNLKSGGDLEWGSRASGADFQIIYCDKCYVKHPSRSIKELIHKSRRTIGGHYEIAKNKGMKALFKLSLTTLLPPLLAIYRLSKRNEFSLWVKVKLSLLKIFLRLIAFAELLLLLLGKNTRRV
jgi:GT2 family glycosyltransferase